jgi:hypothetical protein
MGSGGEYCGQEEDRLSFDSLDFKIHIFHVSGVYQYSLSASSLLCVASYRPSIRFDSLLDCLYSFLKINQLKNPLAFGILCNS